MDIQRITESLETEIEQVMEQISNCFPDRRGRENAYKYILGLMSPIERKNSWQLAEAQGEETPYAIQQFLYRGTWNANDLRDKMREYVKETLADEDAVMVVDETGFLKKGRKSAGVMRQYSGTAGRVENCQIGVFLTYAGKKGFTMIDRELYLPKEWMDDTERCLEAGVPTDVKFRTKPRMALDMLKTAEKSEMPYSWVTGDSVYGDYREIGNWLESISKGYVLAVSGKAYVWSGYKQHRVSTILKSQPEDGWERISAGTGSKGERYYDWLLIPLNAPSAPCWKRYLLVRRSISSPDELCAYVCFCPVDTPLQKLTRIAGTRWTVEQSFEESKGEVGLDHYEVRSYPGWYKHVTLACLAHALLTILKFQAQENPSFQTAIEPPVSESMAGFKKGRGL